MGANHRPGASGRVADLDGLLARLFEHPIEPFLRQAGRGPGSGSVVPPQADRVWPRGPDPLGSYDAA